MIPNISSKKKALKISSNTMKKHVHGFALMVALGLMSFVLVIILGLTTLVQVNSKLTSSGEDLAIAKQNALFALNLAIGDLQNEMGPDQRISATASILDEFPETEIIDGVNNPYWTGAWNSNDSLEGNFVNQVVSQNRSFSDGKPSHFRRWLISTPTNGQSMSPEESIFFAKNFNKNAKNAILLVGAGTVGGQSTEENSVFVPRQIISKQQENENGYAYWIGDEGVKTRIAGSPPGKIKTDLEQILNVNNAGSPRLNAIDGFKDAKDLSTQSDKILTLGTAQFALNQALGGDTNAFKNKFHSLSAFSRGLMVDVKNGGVRKDLSLLFASGTLPLEYENVPMFEFESSEGPAWDYALRYHNIYKKINNQNGRNFINTSAFFEDAKTSIPHSETKYTDLPLPVLARMQLIFSLHKQRNTFNGRINEILLPIEEQEEEDRTEQDENGYRITSITTAADWEAVGDANVSYSQIFGPSLGAELTQNSTDAYFTLSNEEIYPFEFTYDAVNGESPKYVYVERQDILNPQQISVNIIFSGYDILTDEEVILSVADSVQMGPFDNVLLQIPNSPGKLFDEFIFFFDDEDIGQTATFTNVSIQDNIPIPPARYQSNREQILQLMMTPIFYLWNPYNIELVMDDKQENQGAYQYFYSPPDIGFTYDGGKTWTSLKKFQTFAFGLGGEVGNMWSSNNEQNRLTDGESLVIPAGEFRYNVAIPPPPGDSINNDPYIRLQYFNPYVVNYRKLFGDPFYPERNGFEGNFRPYGARWLESTNNIEEFNSVYNGLFSPILNHEGIARGGAGLHTSGVIAGEPKKRDYRLKKVVYPGESLRFGLRLNNQAFASRLSLGGGWRPGTPNYDYNKDPTIYETRLIGALNMDTNFEESFVRSSYHVSESPLIDVSYDDLKPIYENGTFKGAKNAKKIALNIDIRGFSENETPGKHAFFIDPANNYYYDNEESDSALALAPFRIYLKEIENSEILHFDPLSEDPTKIEFETIAGDKIGRCIAKELPLIPLLSLAQLDHAPLGRDYDHFAYFAGRHFPDDYRNHYESYSLKGNHPDDKVRFPGKMDRRMAPSFNMAVGNSWAHPTIPLNDIVETDNEYESYASDRSYLLNETLFDSYFFTGLAFPSGPFKDDMKELSDQLDDWIFGKGRLPNSNYKFSVPRSMSSKQAVETFSTSNVDTLDLFDKIANFLEIEGAFNINSTSVDSWVAQLSSLRGKSVLYDDSDYGSYNIDSTNTKNTPVLSQTIPAEKSLENAGGTIDSIEKNSWSHYRSLEDEQLKELAKEIVKQIKARGPFLSLSQFFNREISDRKPFNIKGAVQTAIDDSYINLESTKENVASALKERFNRDQGNKKWIDKADFTSPEIFEGGSNEGLPGYITQASLLRPLCPIITARSDTFIIRAYGDFIKNGEVKSKAWCEAILQRRIDLIGQNKQLKPKYSKEDPDSFNRQFEIVSFRWLNAEEI